jgi:hypothetical protein
LAVEGCIGPAKVICQNQNDILWFRYCGIDQKKDNRNQSDKAFHMDQVMVCVAKEFS